jgi:hypothetical protein
MAKCSMTEAEWRADREYRRDEAERMLAAATDPKEERRWRVARDNYRRQLTMGQAGLTEAAVKAAATRN